MLIKDKDILADTPQSDLQTTIKPPRINKENMRHAWGDAIDYYLRGITEKYLKFHGRATRLEFWGYFAASGIILIPLYILGVYIDMPMLPYYYVAATFLPAVAVGVRRLHDINKKATPYLIIGMICALSCLFIGWWALLPLGLWAIILIRLCSRATDISEGLYGLPEDTDEIYGEDNLYIIHKFRFYALFLLVLWIGSAMIQFDDWSRQAEQTATNDSIMESIEESGKEAGLSITEIEAAKKMMIQTLKSWNGKMVPEDDIKKAIHKAIQDILAQKQKAAEEDTPQ